MIRPPDDDRTPMVKPIRLAVAMNGGVSLAVWIGGVAHELHRFAASEAGWSELCGERAVEIDVLAGTSAGGMNAAFLAIAERYGVSLSPLRDLWLDVGGLEPAPGAGLAAPHLLRGPSRRAKSLLDGDLFHQRLEEAFLRLIPEATGQRLPLGEDTELVRKRIDLRLTTTSLQGVSYPVIDDLGGTLRERRHQASFHFIDGADADVVAIHKDLGCEHPGDRERLAAELARAARSTASFPFAFEPSRCKDGDGAHLEPEMRRHDLLDGGVLDNLPVDQAIAATFAMPAPGPVDRWLVAVVPDPSIMSADAGAGEAVGPRPDVLQVVSASVVGIPRNQAVGRLIDEIRGQNSTIEGRIAARRELLTMTFDELAGAADRFWATYTAAHKAVLARTLASRLQAPVARVERAIDVFDGALPQVPVRWGDPLGAWGAEALERQVAILLDLHSRGRCPVETRLRIHRLRTWIDQLTAYHDQSGAGPIAPWPEAVDRALRLWPLGPDASPEAVGAARSGFVGVANEAAQVLVSIASTWRGQRPKALDRCATSTGSAANDGSQGAAARTLLAALEVVQGAFGTIDVSTEQTVQLGLLTPQREAPLDAVRRRRTTAAKLAGDELGHFGAFLKRSWRANDWMWGRLDASTFLFHLLGTGGEAPDPDRQLEIQRTIVREEAPHICAAVLADRVAGATSKFGEGLIGDATFDGVPEWPAVIKELGLDQDDPEADFLARCRIGEEQVVGELWSPLVARVGSRAVAATTSVVRGARLPLGGVVTKAVAPIQGVSSIASRYAEAIRPRQRGKPTVWLGVRLLTEVVALAAALSLAGLDFGFLTPFIWLMLGAFLLTFVLLAPATTLLTVALIVPVGLGSAIPESWEKHLPRELATHLPLNRWVSAAAICCALFVIASPKVDAVDRMIRRAVRWVLRRP